MSAAGAYIEGELCSDCPNVLAADQCGCPAGFNASEAIGILSSGCIKEGPKSDLPWIDETIAFCEAPVYVAGRSDWGGAYLIADVAGGGCLGEVDCFAEQSLRVISRASPNQAGDLGFCVR